MAIYRAQIGFVMDSVLPRDIILITPHYTGSDPQALADGLSTNLQANVNVGAAQKFTVNVYNAQGPPPHHPLGTATHGATTGSTAGPREVALCLSYYATKNQPRLRGRLYLPNGLISGASTIVARPTTAQRSAAMSFGPTLFKTLPAGVAPVVYSKKNDSSAPITDYWVDDEWDIVRSRGNRATTRSTGTVP